MSGTLHRRALFRSTLAFPAALGLVAREASAAGGACSPTNTDIQGPFFLSGAPRRTEIADPKEPGERLTIRGRVFSSDCRTPLSGALLDVWQADAKGEYHGKGEEYRLRAQLLTARDGSYEFHTVRPGNYKLDGGWRPAHIHLTISGPGHQPVTTQLYFRGDPYLAPHDACGDGCHSDDPPRIIALEADGGRRAGTFDIVLKSSRV